MSEAEKEISLEDFQRVHINRLNRRVAAQQARIVELERQLEDNQEEDDNMTCIDLLRKHQWSAMAFGNYGSTARKCPECGGLHPSDSLNDGGGRHTKGQGHKPDCLILATLETNVENQAARIAEIERQLEDKAATPQPPDPPSRAIHKIEFCRVLRHRHTADLISPRQ